MIRAPAGQIRIKSIGHHGDCIALPVIHRKFCHHRLRFRQLIFSAIGHQHRSCADGGVEHLDQPLLGTAIEVRQSSGPAVSHQVLIERFLLKVPSFLGRHLDLHIRLLVRAVGIQKCSADIHDRTAAPVHDQPRRLCHDCNLHRFQVLLGGVLQKFLYIVRPDDTGHSFLGFRDRQFGSVKTCVFLRHSVQIDLQSRCQFSDRHRHSACAEIVAFADQSGHFRPAEHALELPLRRRISLLNLSAAHFDGRCGMCLGGSGRAADAVASCPSPQQNDHITRSGSLADHICPRSRRHDSADLHTFCHIVRMVDLFDITGGKADLVAVGTIAVRSFPDQLLLGKFASQCFRHGCSRVGSTSHTHRLIHIGTP